MHKLPSRRTDFALDFENDQVSVSEVSLASRESEAKGMVSEGACTDTMPSISCQARGSSKVTDSGCQIFVKMEMLKFSFSSGTLFEMHKSAGSWR